MKRARLLLAIILSLVIQMQVQAKDYWDQNYKADKINTEGYVELQYHTWEWYSTLPNQTDERGEVLIQSLNDASNTWRRLVYTKACDSDGQNRSTASITPNGVKVEILSNWGTVKNTQQPGLYEKVWFNVGDNAGSNSDEKKAYIRIYIPADYIKTGFKLRQWQYRTGPNGTDKGNYSETWTIEASKNVDFGMSGVKYDYEQSKYPGYARVQWTQKNFPPYSMLSFVDENNNPVEFHPDICAASGGKQYTKALDISSNQKDRLKGPAKDTYVAYFKRSDVGRQLRPRVVMQFNANDFNYSSNGTVGGNGYSSGEYTYGEVLCKGYAWPHEEDIEMELNDSVGTVKFSFGMPTVDNETSVLGDKLQLVRRWTNYRGVVSDSIVDQVDYKATKISYSLSDDYRDSKMNCDVTWLIRRSHTGNDDIWGFNYGPSVTKKIVTEMPQFKNIKAEAYPTNRLYGRITWDYVDGIWPKKSSLDIIVHDVNSNQKDEVISLTQRDAMKGEYLAPLQECSETVYTVRFRPGSGEYLWNPQEGVWENPAVKLSPIVYSNIGHVEGQTASKGYFNDRVEVHFLSIGAMDKYQIWRSPVNQTYRDANRIATIEDDDNDGILDYSDEKAVPGTYYRYYIVGLMDCHGETIKTDPVSTVGFATATGTVYGQVCFEGGSAEADVAIYAEPKEGSTLKGKSIRLTGAKDDYLSVDSMTMMQGNHTIQALVCPESDGSIVWLDDTHELAYTGGNYVYKAGGVKVSTKHDAQADGIFEHVTAVQRGDTLQLYINGVLKSEVTGAPIDSINSHVQMGRGMKGNLDEVRLWDIALDAASVERDFNRYLHGGEQGLIAYWRFNDGVDGEFYDLAHDSNDRYYMHDGTFSKGAKYDEKVPEKGQLSFMAISDVDGTYVISGLPYAGTGTLYTLTPVKGTHEFSTGTAGTPTAQRMISADQSTHNVDFTDKSAFNVSGFVYYSGSTIPSPNVFFKVDGTIQMNSEGEIITTKEDGTFTLQVPVGVHKVQAVLSGHTFELDGRICNSDGSNRNYQANVENIHLYDATRIRFMGRVAGGEIQAEQPLGHSLSKNNLGENLSVVLKLKTEEGLYHIVNNDSTAVIEHDRVLNLKNVSESRLPKTRVDYTQTTITIYPDATTGEFIADLPPVEYKVVSANASGYGNIMTANESLNFTEKLADEYSVNLNELKDDEGNVIESQLDSVRYNATYKFIKYNPTVIEMAQADNRGRIEEYFGSEVNIISNSKGEDEELPLYENGSYLMGAPVFISGVDYQFRLFASQQYPFYDANGEEQPKKLDKVPVRTGKFAFQNGIADISGTDSLAVDTLTGVTYYKFTCGEPDISANGPFKKITLKLEANDATTLWNGGAPFEAIVVGSKASGTRFVTTGPDHLNFILRDPPGSHSTAYMERGFTSSSTSTYTWSLGNEGSEMFGAIAGGKFGTIKGGVITQSQATTDLSFGIVHSESGGRERSQTTTVTYTERYETSEDLVGAEGDLFVGNSTNINYGTATFLSITPKALYNSASMSKIRESANGDYYIVREEGISFGISYGTHFAYSQSHIVNSLIPDLIEKRNAWLTPHTVSDADAQALAQNNSQRIYRSNLPAEDENFGKKGTYKMFYPQRNGKPVVEGQDTINILNQSIDAWYGFLAQNEKEKVLAKPAADHPNVSYDGGASYSRDEGYSVAYNATGSFEFSIGAATDNEIVMTDFLGGTTLKMEEQIVTTQGWSDETDLENSTNMGFTLSDDVGDYMSVDICKYVPWDYLSEDERKDLEDELDDKLASNYDNSDELGRNYDKLYGKYGSFVYKLKGGATRCPHEDEYLTEYYEEGTKIGEGTARRDVPVMSADNTTVVDVADGKEAMFTIYLSNASETKEEATYYLYLDPYSNPYGATVTCGGKVLSTEMLPMTIPYGETLTQTVYVKRGAAAYDYTGLKLLFGTECGDVDPAEQIINASWVRQAGDVNISQPQTNWILNTTSYYINDDGDYIMPVKIDGYDVNSTGFQYVALEYKPSSGSANDWTVACRFYADEKLMEAASGEKEKIQAGGTISYDLLMQSLGDNAYDLRAACHAIINGNESVKYSAIVPGLKDTKRPTLYGNIKPEDGVLDYGDNIELKFNEPIAENLLSANNFQVTGTKVGEVLSRAASIRFDGDNDCLFTEAENNLEGKDFTVETGLYIDKLDHDATIFSFGKKGEAFQLGINDKKKLTIQSGGKSYTAPEPLDLKTGEWEHIGVIYQAATDMVSVYYNGVSVWDVKIERPAARGVFTIGLGADGKNGFQGKLSEFRIWDRAMSRQKLVDNRNISLAANQVGLFSYYPMNEGRGTVAEDVARGANAVIGDATWFINRDGRALQLNASKLPAADITIGSTPISTDDDFTLEFWFRGQAGQKNVALFSNGQGESEADKEAHMTVGFNEQGALHIKTYGVDHVSTLTASELLNDAWHHIAVALNRSSNVASLYVDGKYDSQFAASNIKSFMSTYATLGCRTVIPSSDDMSAISKDMFKYDQGMNGFIDDVRLWNYAKTSAIINEECNVALKGNEPGLMAYYPFEKYVEWQGTQEMQFTREDMSAEGINNKNPEMTGSGAESTNTAPVKEAGAVNTIMVNWTVNNDGMIITPYSGSWKEYDQTIVTYRVTDLQDKHGNATKSPIAFSLYIDQSQTKWSQNEVNLSLEKGAGATFTVDALNEGGSNMAYTIENQPSWLTVSPAKGTLSPRSAQHITFRVDKAVNPGTYTETVYLINGDGLARALHLIIKVRGNEPDWSVDPHDFAYSMNVVGQLRLNGSLSEDEEDIIAAFDGEKCVGVTKNTYNASKGLNYTFLTIYGNETKGTAPLTFRVWDASSDRVLTASSSSGDITFANNTVLGSVESPVTFTTDSRVVEDVALAKGWNWISFNIAAANIDDINTMLKPGSWSNGDEVKTETQLASYSANNKKWMGTLAGFNYTSLFKVKAGKGQTLSFEGVPVDVASTEIPVQSNWNYISYLPTIQLTLKEALAGYNAQKGDILKSQTGFAQYDSNNGWVGNVDFMEPGQGYMLFRNSSKSTSFKYPSSSSTTRRNVRRIAAADPEEMYNHPYASNMNMIAITQGYELQDGDNIVVYAGDERRSFAGQVSYDGLKLWFLTIEGEEEVPLLFTVENNGETVATGKSGYAFAPDVVCGTLERPIELTLTGVRQGVNVSPVAFDTQFTVTVNQPGAQHVDVKVYNPSGQQIMSHSANNVGGAYSHQFNGSSLARGSYLVRVTVDGEPTTINVIRR